MGLGTRHLVNIINHLHEIINALQFNWLLKLITYSFSLSIDNIIQSTDWNQWEVSLLFAEYPHNNFLQKPIK